MRLPLAVLTTAAVTLPSVVAIANLNKEERASTTTPRKKTIFHKDGFTGEHAESVSNMLKQYHAYPKKKSKENSVASAEQSSSRNEATLDQEILSARRSITRNVVEKNQASPVEKETNGAAADAANANVDANAQKDSRQRRARKQRRGRYNNERRAAAQKDEEKLVNTAEDADGQNKEQQVGTTSRQLHPEQRQPNPRPPPRENPKKEGKPNRARRDLHDSPGRFTNDKRDLKKSKKGSYSSSSFSGGSGTEDTCIVHMTNLTPRQEWSDIFVMTHSEKLYPRLFEYGEPAFDDLAALAQDGDTDELVWYYDGPYGDDHVYWVSSERGPIRPGESISFGIDASGSYDRLTLATSFIFSNDGFVAINGEEIYDGATFWLWGIDAGVEANTQLCWTVQASASQFPVNADCYKDQDTNFNDNSILGVGYVHVHGGIQDLQGKGDAKDFLAFSCDDLNANNFAEYFYESGFDDDELLKYDDDQEFLDYLSYADDLQREYVLVDLALDAGDFFAFCDELDAITNFFRNGFTTIEPRLFDFRTPMMKVELEC